MRLRSLCRFRTFTLWIHGYLQASHNYSCRWTTTLTVPAGRSRRSRSRRRRQYRIYRTAFAVGIAGNQSRARPQRRLGPRFIDWRPRGSIVLTLEWRALRHEYLRADSRTSSSPSSSSSSIGCSRPFPSCARMPRGALLDHLPEFLTSLSAWVDGNADAAKDAFDALCMGHALQRLGFGIDLESVTLEYSILRGVLIETLFASDVSPSLRPHALAFHRAMDHAVGKAVRRYMGGREEIRERFVGILGHDLRNPLNSIVMSAAQLLRAHDLSDANRKSAITHRDRSRSDASHDQRRHGLCARPSRRRHSRYSHCWRYRRDVRGGDRGAAAGISRAQHCLRCRRRPARHLGPRPRDPGALERDQQCASVWRGHRRGRCARARR